MYTLHNTRLGTFASLDEAEFKEVCRFYKLFQNRNGIWQNGRGDIYVWEKTDMEIER